MYDIVNNINYSILQVNSNRFLHWFKEIKESHGSVEVTSLKQVDAIKDRGIFKVGYPGNIIKSKHQLVNDLNFKILSVLDKYYENNVFSKF